MLIAAIGVRIWTGWHEELRGLSVDRVRVYAGCFLLVWVAISVSSRIIATTVGLGDTYLLLGPFSRAPGAFLAMTLLTALGSTLVLGLPAGAWLAAVLRRGALMLELARARAVIEHAEVATLPVFEDEKGPESSTKSGDDVLSSAVEKPDQGQAPRRGRDPQDVPAWPRAEHATLPPIELFKPAPRGPSAALDVEHIARRIEETLASFNVSARVVGHHCGPVVTQFDVQPNRGVKVRRITELQNDLALALAAPTIRIQAPVPGKPVVGIEIPNSAASMVALRDLLESEVYRSHQSPLKVALGKDVAGTPVIVNLAKLPHLLIAGATGSGKSVCVNAIISCLLHHNLPEHVRLMMIDPKMVELTVYNGVPHLLSPVVTQMDKVVGVLQWALREMERRYQLFADNTVRNIQRYNEKMEASKQPRLPYIVLIVDELADLMMVAPEDVEDAICRLAQLARAAGIHLVIATQRPSVDVVTGLIKANFPARIAFAMTSQVDSRTILDTAGAEKLLGRGDMLYQPSDAPKPMRLQGALVSDQEIERLVEFWQCSPLQVGVGRVPEEEFAAAGKAAAETPDDLMEEAVRAVRAYQHASVSLLQRRLKIGYARAARLMDQLEAAGVVGSADGSRQRPVLDQHERRDLGGEGRY